MSRTKRVSVVVPTYREPDLQPFLQRLSRALAPLDGEIVIVDDSDDATHDALRASATGWSAVEVRVLRGTRRGKGDAIRIGLLAAEGAVLLYLDADIEESKLLLLPQFVSLIENDGYNVVMGERRSRWEYRNFGRFLLSLGLFLAQRLFIFQSARFFDTQFGFKAFDRESARHIASLQTVPGGMIDIEHLYIATRNHMRIAQLPVTPVRELRPSRLRILRCLVTDPIALLRVKWNGVRGRYER
ncbi:MAG TPA: glycosyltransferase [Thermoanaerobaculia bacterium]|nr:glycosyltransferase [Thermoanaerobaculia bacterium]